MRVFFTNLGCKLNQAEVEAMTRRFREAGHLAVSSLAVADLHVVNSCTVTGAAARSSRKSARGGGRMNPRLRTVLTGCYATAEPAEAARLAGVDLVVPNRDKDRLLERVLEAFPEAADETSTIPCSQLDLGHTRALVKVEDGCDMRCAFCIIPSTRGRQHSRPAAEVVAEVRSRVAAGYREVVLTGVQISAWRSHAAGGAERLPELVRAVLESGGAPRLRLTSIAPWELDPRLLDLFADRRLCRHLHLSLQSGSAATLRRMRRPYDPDRYAALLDRVRAAIPGVAVTTDVIVGFPGETPAEFRESLAFVAAIAFARVHVFPYSARAGTEAADLPDQVAAAEKRERMAQMLAVAEAAEREFQSASLGRRETVLWERPRDGLAHGLTGNYIRVFSRTADDLWNRFVPADLVALCAGGVMGEVAGAGLC
ncbi:MAG TPA: tRNA (N(6)-L-threonylcarbamoyladenosine(37)-C(2))-methylthiotransferase MtaB [Thermoanaerobaculia bacterium]|nr:tRNA (N(6)-L-threonylcarbamoyladenosine(37)-C(2))-methylthiotransferase MtaB [Thermoanaerobaculia bacterium]